jgi:DNA-binding NtrC family response regulator
VTRRFVKELLASRNCAVVEAGSVVEALAAVRRRRFDLFLVDFQLPGGNGIEFIRQIGDDCSLTRVVVTLAFADLTQADQLFGLGAMTLLRKPLDAGQLIECVDRILGASQPGKNSIEAEKVARQGRRPAAISPHLNQSLQPREPVADADG